MLEQERLKDNELIFLDNKKAVSGDTAVILVHNVRSIPRHVDDTVSDNRIINNDIIEYTGT